MKLHIQLKYGLLVFSFRLKALAGSIVLDWTKMFWFRLQAWTSV